MALWLKHYPTNRQVAGSIHDGVTGFFIDIFLPTAPWPWGRFSPWWKWDPGVFPGGKGGRCVKLTTLPPSCTFVMKSGNLNFLEPSGPLQACNGTAWPFYYKILNSGLMTKSDKSLQPGMRNFVSEMGKTYWQSLWIYCLWYTDCKLTITNMASARSTEGLPDKL